MGLRLSTMSGWKWRVLSGTFGVRVSVRVVLAPATFSATVTISSCTTPTSAATSLSGPIVKGGSGKTGVGRETEGRHQFRTF